MRLKFFWPEMGMPKKDEMQTACEMFYPGSRLLAFYPVKDNPDNFARWTTSLVYAGALLGGKYAKDIALKSPSISEGDVAFLNTSMGLGYLNSILLGYAMDLKHYKDQTMLSLAGVNGFLFLANSLNKKYGSLSQGQENIVSLGVGSSYLAWLGIAMLTQYDYRKRSARYIDVALSLIHI